MEHQTKLLWMHEGIVIQPQPSPRGRRVVGLVFRGTLIGLASVTEDDYQVAFREAGLFTDAVEGGSGRGDEKPSDQGTRPGVRGHQRGRIRPASSRDGGAPRGTPIAIGRPAVGDSRAADADGTGVVVSDELGR